ncbi:heavy metal translocating P-type ATPase [bacterium]|nr:heavy metal translocating P-type ATPase [bacterium]
MISQFRIDGMDCSSEEQVIRNHLGKKAEIEGLEFDLVNRTLTVNHRYASEEPIRSMLKAIGLPADAECTVGCEHEQKGLERSDLFLGVGLALAILAEVVAFTTGNERSLPVLGMALGAIALGGITTFKKGLVAIKTVTLNINLLMCIAVIGAFAIGSYPEAAMVTVLFAIAERIESFALDRARNAVRSLMTLAPETALLSRENTWAEVQASEVLVGEMVRVRPGDRIPLDGIVLSGQSTVNQAPITGESVPVSKVAGDTLFAGTINGEGVLEFKVSGIKGNTTLDRIIKTVQEAQGSRAPTQRFIDSFARYYTPAVVVIALLVAVTPTLFGQPFLPWLYKALVLLVIACPCALVISTPVTVVSGLAAAAKLGILIKGGAHLESGRKLTLIALDKTGTLTHGEPKVTKVVALHDHHEDLVKQLAASLDSTSAHPIAKAIIASWSGSLIKIDNFESLTGRGVTGIFEGNVFYLGNHRLIEEKGICCDHVHDAIEPIEKAGQSLVLLANAKEVMGVFAVSDTVRNDSTEAVRRLHDLGLKVVMLTGDNQATAQSIGRQVGIDVIKFEMLPEHKLEVVRQAEASGEHVGMVGDGVNDAPALAASTVGFAMGAAGTDTAIETADVALMDDDLRKLPEYIVLSRKTSTILKQNITFALMVKFAFFALALSGTATLWMAVFADLGASLIVVANGLRLRRLSNLAD